MSEARPPAGWKRLRAPSNRRTVLTPKPRKASVARRDPGAQGSLEKAGGRGRRADTVGEGGTGEGGTDEGRVTCRANASPFSSRLVSMAEIKHNMHSMKGSGGAGLARERTREERRGVERDGGRTRGRGRKQREEGGWYRWGEKRAQ